MVCARIVYVLWCTAVCVCLGGWACPWQVYKRVKDSVTCEKEAVICQRENPFYVNTVMAFRDRRYDYKGLTKVRGLVPCPPALGPDLGSLRIRFPPPSPPRPLPLPHPSGRPG